MTFVALFPFMYNFFAYCIGLEPPIYSQFRYAARFVIYKLSNLLQPSNAYPPTLVTLSGIVMLVRLLQL